LILYILYITFILPLLWCIAAINIQICLYLQNTIMLVSENIRNLCTVDS